MKHYSWPNWSLWLTKVLVVATVYYAAAIFARSLAEQPGTVMPVWPASGISLAAVILLGYEVWPGIWLGQFLEAITALLSEANAPPVATSIALSAFMGVVVTVPYVLGSFLLRRFVGHQNLLDRAADVFKFVALGAIFICAVSATLGSTSLCLAGICSWDTYGQTWATWFLGDTVGILVVAPALLIWIRPISNLRFSTLPSYLKSAIAHPKFFEAVLLLVLLVSICQVAFGGGYPVAYLVIPCLVWAAFRFGQRGATLLILIVSSSAIWGTVHGHGPFIRESLNESLLLLQCFVGVIAVTTIILAAVIVEREQAEASLQRANELLEQRVEERTAALMLANEALQQSEVELREKASQIERAMRELQLTQSQLIQTEKMSSLGQLVAGVAHEINNPVSFIYGNVTPAKQYIDDLLHLLQLYRQHYPNPTIDILELSREMDLEFILEDLPKLLTSMKMGADRIRSIVLSLRNFSRLDESEMKPVDIHEGLDSTLLLLQNRLKADAGNREIQIIKEYGNLPSVECYAGQLNQVFMNLLANAIDALEKKDAPRIITISTSVKIREAEETQKKESSISNPQVVIRIADNGIGMAEHLQKRLFDPFFTTKPVGKGTGLGLSISYQIVVEKHKGQLRCISKPMQGTEFIIEIPIQQSSSKLLSRSCALPLG
ncbi:MASE1 domain-containing protein [Microcoleus sp. FACHB-68]|uniref:MASE1 domain-containing protein n=1 Tax=Microcoleus sp. FACHB-68 TaxID=2692826 RepID=UPI0016858EEC|nr:MASE1 domain-containing protein [Microcoleus sp. FACHB-68]MBD1938737.1 MASE1 domain-containing protein [Microcoleus sp. FACHB-68]